MKKIKVISLPNQIKSSILLMIALIALFCCNGIEAQEISTLRDSFKVNGSAGIQLSSYTSKGIPNRRKPFSYTLYGNITLSKGEFSIPLSFTYSEQERSFSQPFNQFGIAPSYKWAKVYLGYQNVNWSKFSLGGHQFLGAGFELTPGKLRLGFVAGRFQRATKIDSSKSKDYLPAYKRNGFAAKVGFGSEDNFIDFIYMRSRDDDKSLPGVYADSIAIVQPGRNDVLSARTQIKIGSFMSLYGEAAASVYNRNINAPEKAPDDGYDFVSKIVGKQTIATQLYVGAETGTNLHFKGQNLNLFYKHIAPDFQSMGAYYIENDLNAYGLRHSFGMFRNRAQISYSMSVFSDNLLNKKPVTTYRYQPNVNISINPSTLWGIDVSWMDLYTKQKDGFVAVNDTIIMQNRNPGYTIAPRINWGGSRFYHMVVGSYLNMRMIDNNAFTAAYMQYSAEIVNLMYNFSVLKKQSSVNIGVNRTKNTTNAFTETGYGGSAGYNQSWNEGIVNARAGLALQISDINTNYTINAGVNYTLKKRHILGATLLYLNNKTDNVNSQDFTEITGVLQYTINF